MGHQKILNLLNKALDSKFVTRNWNIVNDQSNANYSVGNQIIYSTEVEVLNSKEALNQKDAYNSVNSDITIIGCGETHVAFKICVPCTTKIEGTLQMMMKIQS